MKIFVFALLSVSLAAMQVKGDSLTVRVAYLGNTTPFRLPAALGAGFDVRYSPLPRSAPPKAGSYNIIRQEEWKEGFLPQVVLMDPGRIMEGATRFVMQSTLGGIVDSLRHSRSSPRVILLLSSPESPADTSGRRGAELRDSVFPAIRMVAYRAGVELLDLSTCFLDQTGRSICLPSSSPERAAEIARRIAEHIRRDSIAGFDLLQRAHITGTVSEYFGYTCVDFQFEGRGAKIVMPKRMAKGAPWLWRARFWGHEPQTERALLERGFHLVYCDVAELFGNDESIHLWDGFYRMLTDAGLCTRAAMMGLSRGGIYVYRWAVQYPDRIACIYADAPVLDFKSWPGGKGRGHGNPEEWERFKKNFGLTTESEAIAFKGNPIDLVPQIASGGYPMLHICGDADVTVPIEENTIPFEEKVRARGGDITVIHKPGVGHHPHSLVNPQPIVDFILHAYRRWLEEN
jgi:pimeloyl-ACP methyl ester carboxylesterase